MNVTIPGGCLCGRVQFEVEDSFQYALVCHCSGCRRATGAGNKPFAGIGKDKLRVTRGQASLFTYGDDAAHDVRCSVCGSLLYSVVRGGEYVHVALGALSASPGLTPSRHIFVGSKADWEVIDDGLPQHDEF